MTHPDFIVERVPIRAVGNKERVKVVCRGREIAAVIPLEDLELPEDINLPT